MHRGNRMRSTLIFKRKKSSSIHPKRNSVSLTTVSATPSSSVLPLGLTLNSTDKPGYGGEVIGFKQEGDFLFALHRVWNQIPSERRNERIASPSVSDRIMTNGCINVSDAVYEKLRHYFVLEVI